MTSYKSREYRSGLLRQNHIFGSYILRLKPIPVPTGNVSSNYVYPDFCLLLFSLPIICLKKAPISEVLTQMKKL